MKTVFCNPKNRGHIRPSAQEPHRALHSIIPTTCTVSRVEEAHALKIIMRWQP